jgi:hypothetical protein
MISSSVKEKRNRKLKKKKEAENCAEKKMHEDFPDRFSISVFHFFLCSPYLNFFKGPGAGIVGEYGGMEKDKKETENCAKKKMHADFWAPYLTSTLHHLLCSLYLNLFKGLGAGIVGKYGRMEKEGKRN